MLVLVSKVHSILKSESRDERTRVQAIYQQRISFISGGQDSGERFSRPKFLRPCRNVRIQRAGLGCYAGALCYFVGFW